MSLTVTDDVGKPVESADGETLGSVAADAERAPLDPEPDMTDSITAVLDWEPASGDIVPLEDDAIDEVTDDTVRLSGPRFRRQASHRTTNPNLNPNPNSRGDDGSGRRHRRVTPRRRLGNSRPITERDSRAASRGLFHPFRRGVRLD